MADIPFKLGEVDVQSGRIDCVTLHQRSIQVGVCDAGVTLSYVETGRESVVFVLSCEQVESHIADLTQAWWRAFGGVKPSAGLGV